MVKRKSKELLLAEIAYACGRKDALGDAVNGDEEEIVRIGGSLALAEWKKQTGGRKPAPTILDLAFKKWTEDGRPPSGTVYDGISYKFTAEKNGQFSVSYGKGSIFEGRKTSARVS